MQIAVTHHILNRTLGLFFFVMLAVTTAPAYAEEPNSNAARELLEATSVRMIDALNSHREQIKADPAVTTQLIEKILMPNIDFITASKWVLGKYWDSATKEQKIQFIKAFRTLLLRFYSTALTEYLNSHDEVLKNDIMVFQQPGPANNNQVTVRSQVSPKTGTPVPVNYQMQYTRRGWKVYDVSVEGVSVITTYKTSFASEIEQSGIDALIRSVQERNEKLLAGDTSQLKTNTKQ